MVFSRILIIVMTALFNFIGFFAGFGVIVFMIATTITLEGRKYLYPLIPFDKKAFCHLLVRKSINKSVTENQYFHMEKDNILTRKR